MIRSSPFSRTVLFRFSITLPITALFVVITLLVFDKIEMFRSSELFIFSLAVSVILAVLWRRYDFRRKP